MFKLYNTLSKKIEEIPQKDHLNLYTCGPTVYNYAHIGNLRSYIMADLLYRTLKYDGYKPKWVMNITDIDDKTIKGTIAEYGDKATPADLYKFTEKYYQAFLDDLREVNVLVDDIEFIRVTDKMVDIQEFIVQLIDKGYAYKADDGSTYFPIDKYQKDFGDYGVLVGEKFIEGKKVGARVKVDEYEKDNLSDFALWKAHSAEDANIFWDHPTLGKGRPGWHIECSVINQVAFKGEPTDIHTGGVDLIFPHHTNEIAQSQALAGKGNFVHYWFHSEHLLVEGKKMAKSAGNFYLLKDVLPGGSSAGSVLRYLFLQNKYSSQQNFTNESLTASIVAHSRATALFRAVDFDLLSASPKESKYSNLLLNVLSNDLNSSEGLGYLFEMLSDSLLSLEERSSYLLKIDEILGLGLGKGYLSLIQEKLTPEIEELLAQRNKAKQLKDFKKSDELRKQIEDLGYEVMDTPEGQKVKKKLQI